ncbi:MAG: LysE family transporter [Deltaproteobacteria bacterium]|nr:LysE family transporter [Deltaproteobacteria bacterium]
MSFLVLYFSSFIVALSGALMPGPLLAVTLGNSPSYGWKFGPLAVLGHGILELGLVSLVFLGAGPLFQARPVQGWIGLAGGLILVWMGKGMFTVVRSGEFTEKPSGPEQSGRRAVFLGIAGSLSNPYWTLWWATVGLAYLTVAAERGPLGVAVFFAGHISGDLAWYTLVSTTVSRGIGISDMKFYSTLMYLCSMALVVLGFWFIYYGVRLVV